jgi:hypothetical protein
MSSSQLPAPTPDLVIQANARFDRDDRYGPADRILSRVFLQHPSNALFEDVLLKVVFLNSLYNTNVFAVWEMARHILELAVDPALQAADLHLVERIARLTIRGKTRRHYSFATKYCSWHRPEDFPIYDSLVDRVLIQYRDCFAFGQFSRSDLQEYWKYKEVLAAFRTHFGLDKFSFKQIDKFLWFTSKDLGAAQQLAAADPAGVRKVGA